MNPIILFDKSFLQALSPDEAKVLNYLFRTNITPELFMEVLGDLEQKGKDINKNEADVVTLSYKMPKFSSHLNISYNLLCISELLGNSVEMNNVPIVWEGKETAKNLIFEESHEVRLFKAWADGHFTEEHRQTARAYRNCLTLISEAHTPILEKQILKFNGEQLKQSVGKIGIKEFVDAVLCYKNDIQNSIDCLLRILFVDTNRSQQT
jgi:hypothetical protein